MPSGLVKLPQDAAQLPTANVRCGILLADDDPDLCEMAEASLVQRGYRVSWRMSPDDVLTELEANDYAVLIVDIHMEGQSGLELCRAAIAKRPDLPVIVMTGFGTMEHAVEAIRAGAYDFVTKPVSMDALSLIINRAVRERSMKEELRRLRRRVENCELPSVVGSSSAMIQMTDLIARVAETDTTVLITGESGTGKELVARALHEHSGRHGQFLAINCAAVPENLLESELFGHVRGAFTDARTNRAGLFVEANQGTLFLDEVGEMPLPMQAKLLRALQERRVRPVGSSQEVPFDARIVAATNRDLEAEVMSKHFREDLYYRVSVVRVEVPPLRKRGDDGLELAQFFLQRAAKRSGKAVKGLDRTVADAIMSYDWPGNVRELENCIERAVALARFDSLTLDDLPNKIRDHKSTDIFTSTEDPLDMPTMDVVEQRYIRKVMRSVNGNKTLASSVLGIDRRTLYRKLRADT